MNYVNFMRKLEGKEPQHDTGDSTTSGPRPLDLQGIIEFARGLGYSHFDLEARPEVPTDNRADFFWAGYNGITWSAALGLYSYGSYSAYCFLSAGRRYQREQGDTHSQQQDSVPYTTTEGYVRSGWIVNSDNVDLDEIRTIIRRIEPFSMGSPPASPQPREEPEGLIQNGDRVSVNIRSNGGALRSALSAEESGVQGVRNERSSRERSAEDTREYVRRGLERSEGW
jgi:hypothetical protein